MGRTLCFPEIVPIISLGLWPWGQMSEAAVIEEGRGCDRGCERKRQRVRGSDMGVTGIDRERDMGVTEGVRGSDRGSDEGVARE